MNMLSPKKTKYRKQFKGRIHGNSKGNYALNSSAIFAISLLYVLTIIWSNKLDLNAEVFQKDIFNEKDIETDLIIARAFKPLPIVLELAEKNFKKFKSIIIFLGKNKKDILEKALANWSFDYKEKKSLTSSESKIIKICNLKKNEN